MLQDSKHHRVALFGKKNPELIEERKMKAQLARERGGINAGLLLIDEKDVMWTCTEKYWQARVT